MSTVRLDFDFGEEALTNFRDKEFIVYDLETTGVDPANDEIVEFYAALVKQVNNSPKIIETLHLYVDPGMPIPEGASAVHGITAEVLQEKGACRIDRLLPKIMDFIQQGAYLVAYNGLRFDNVMMRATLERWGYDDEFLYPTLDPWIFYVESEGGKRGTKLANAARRYGVSTTAATMTGQASYHEASTDVRALAEIFVEMGKHDIRSYTLAEALEEQTSIIYKKKLLESR